MTQLPNGRFLLVDAMRIASAVQYETELRCVFHHQDAERSKSSGMIVVEQDVCLDWAALKRARVVKDVFKELRHLVLEEQEAQQ